MGPELLVMPTAEAGPAKARVRRLVRRRPLRGRAFLDAEAADD
jgi:hypothetical protein